MSAADTISQADSSFSIYQAVFVVRSERHNNLLHFSLQDTIFFFLSLLSAAGFSVAF